MQPNLSGTKILIVEDDEDARGFLARQVALFGATALQASDGAEGLRVARTERPDLVLCDIRMPAIDGFDFIREVRRDDYIAGLRVVAVSAFESSVAARRIWQHGFSDYLSKPIDFDALRTMLERLFWNRRSV